MEQIETDCFDHVISYLTSCGWIVLEKPHKNSNGFDLEAHNNKRTIRVEIKTAIKKEAGSYQTEAVSDCASKCDFIAIIFKENLHIKFDVMSEHLAQCAGCGVRSITKYARLIGL